MSVWSQAQRLPPMMLNQIKALYSDNFPIEVRHFLAPWIEDTMWNYGDGDGIMDQTQNSMAQVFMESLIGEIQRKAESMVNPEMFVNRMKLTEAAKTLIQRYSNNPWQLFSCIQQCLKKEIELIQNASNYIGQEMPMAEMKYSELIEGLNSVRAVAASINEEIRMIDTQQQSFALNFHECTKNKASLHYLSSKVASEETRKMEMAMKKKIEDLERSLTNIVSANTNTQLILAERLTENIETLAELQRRVLDEELNRWKREQQLNGNGAIITTPLNTIQDWCETLADLIWLTWQQVKDLARHGTKEYFTVETVPERLAVMDKRLQNMLSTLVKSTFLIEKQPPQVMKTNTRFTSTIRLLVGGQLNVHMNPPQVSVIIITESQAQALVKSESEGVTKLPKEICGEILNNTGSMEYQPSSKQLSANFRNMQLRKIKRAEKKGTECVMDEKLSLLFTSEFKVGGGEMTFHIWTLSLPVVVIVHGNQEPHGWATVTWDNAFAAPGRIPFIVPDKVPWGQLAETLNLKFNAATGKKLTDANLRFLAEKVFNRTPIILTDHELNSTPVSWGQFCKETLPERTFTFWEWFYMVMKVTREHLRAPWCDGLILGFIQKKQAEELLSKCPKGTFLMRFSDSELGGITIAFVHDAGEGKIPEVLSVQPFATKDLTLRPLAERVKDLNDLIYLYREDGLYTHKLTAFKKYYESTPSDQIMLTNGGYVRALLRTGIATPRSLNSPPTSPGYPGYGSDIDGCKIEEYNELLNEMYSPSNSYCMDFEQFEQNEFLDSILAQAPNILMPSMLNGQSVSPFVNGMPGTGVPIPGMQQPGRMVSPRQIQPAGNMFPRQEMTPAGNMASPQEICHSGSDDSN